MLFNTRFHRGTSRDVLVIPFLKIAIKFAQIHPIETLRDLIFWAEIGTIRGNHQMLRDYLVNGFDGQLATMRHQLFAGIRANYLERRFYRKTKNIFLWPTYFSFFGLVNIQPMIPCCLLPDREINHFVHNLTQGLSSTNDGHAFASNSNYTFDSSGHLRMIDYANPKGQIVIAQFGEQIYTQSRSIFNGK